MKPRSFKKMMEALKSGGFPDQEGMAFASGEIYYENGKVVKKVLHHSENLDYEEAKKMQEMAEAFSPNISGPDFVAIAKEIEKLVNKMNKRGRF